MSIQVWNRKEAKWETEKVLGDKLVSFAYETHLGQKLVSRRLVQKGLSRALGAYENSWLSQFKIRHFVKDYQIPLEDFEQGPFKNFNSFFARRFLKGKRPFSTETKRFCAFAEGRYLVFPELKKDTQLPVKGLNLSLDVLLGRSKWIQTFEGGSCVIARLCPKDYHRFHFPDDGQFLSYYRIDGGLHSVNPKALSFDGSILVENQREISILKSKHFGPIAMIEVGAIGVGKIEQTHQPLRPFERGAEKGTFYFGGSTVILLASPGALLFDNDLIEMSRSSRECFVELGQGIAQGKP